MTFELDDFTGIHVPFIKERLLNIRNLLDDSQRQQQQQHQHQLAQLQQHHQHQHQIFQHHQEHLHQEQEQQPQQQQQQQEQQEQHLQHKENIYICSYPGCQKTFSRYYNLKSHVKTHTGERPYRCDQCSATFGRNHDLKRHKRIHAGIKPYSCSTCKKSFSRMDALNRHMTTNCAKKQKREEVGGSFYLETSTVLDSPLFNTFDTQLNVPHH